MGFGLLFLGYVITFISSMNPFGAYIRAFGSILLFVSAKKLGQYNRFFKYSMYSSVLFIALSFATATFSAFDILYENLLISTDPIPQIADDILKYLIAVSALLFNGTLLFAIRKIAIETESDGIATSCISNAFFMGVYFVLYALLYLLPGDIGVSYTKYMSMPIVLLNLAWLIMNAVLIFRCYVRICDENDVDMEKKESKFKIFGRK